MPTLCLFTLAFYAMYTRTCTVQNSRDNMSVVLVTFPGAPKVSQEAIEEVNATEFACT